MRMHALRVGAFFSIAYVACLLWPITMTDPAVINFHLLSLKVVFPGFQGFDALSMIWGGLLAFAYGYLISTFFHMLHGDCCTKNGKKNGENGATALKLTDNALSIGIVLAVGILLGLVLSRPLGLASDTAAVSRPTFNPEMMRRAAPMMNEYQNYLKNQRWMMQQRGEE